MKKKKHTVFLSVVVPIFNESLRLHNISKIFEYLKKQSYLSEIIIVNDGSTDTSLQLLKELSRKYSFSLVSYKQNKGKGYALKKGMLHAQGEWRVFMDVDLSTPLDSLSVFLKFTKKHAVLIGSRRKKHSLVLIHQPRIRETMGHLFTKLSQCILQMDTSDFTCGFKMFRGDAAEKIFSASHIHRWGFDPEIIFLARKYKYKIHEIPVAWFHNPYTQVRFPQDAIKSLHELLLIRINNLLGKYD